MTLTTSKMTDPTAIVRYLLGGRAILTLRSLRTDEHRTYRVRESDNPALFFVDLLSGSDNEHDYTYLGCIWADRVAPSAGKINRRNWGKDAWRVFRWFLTQLHKGSLHPELEVWHEGRCSHCSRPLTDPLSIERGIGPVCYERAHLH